MKKLFLLMGLALVVSCARFSEKVVKGFEDNRWGKEHVEECSITVPADIKDAGIYVYISHVHEPGYKKVPVQVEIETPDGTIENVYLLLQLTDKHGKSLSDCAGDICELYTPLRENILVTKGTYRFKLKNRFNAPYLPNVLSAGIEIRSAN